jgi:hypothetical protein
MENHPLPVELHRQHIKQRKGNEAEDRKQQEKEVIEHRGHRTTDFTILNSASLTHFFRFSVPEPHQLSTINHS